MIEIRVPSPTPVWQPKVRNNDSFLLSLWENPQNADTRIVVQGHSIPVHKLVLQYQARHLFDLVTAAAGADGSVLTIDYVSPESCKAVLRYFYTGILPDVSTKEADAAKEVDAAKELLDIADHLGCVELKLKMEYDLAKKHLTPWNLVNLLMFADLFSCALLKETALNKFPKWSHVARESEGWAALKKRRPFFDELFDTVIPSIFQTAEDREVEGSFDKLTVCGLRKRLERDGLELDGSRDTLIKRLKRTHDEVDAGCDGTDDQEAAY